MFPLNTVLFPGQLLPLHIFEPRYREMIEECIASDSSFGVVLIRDGREVGETATPFEVGTTARVGQVNRLEDGHLNILCVGDYRFRLHSTSQLRAFLTGTVELWPWEPLAEPSLDPRAGKIQKLLVRYMQLLAKATGNTIAIEEMPAEADQLANLAAIVLQVPNHEKQTLLSSASVGELLDGCLDLLQRENRAISIASSVPLALSDSSLPFSTN